MKKYISLLLLTAIFLLTFSGCQFPGSKKTLLDPTNPVTLTIWHVYGEQADAPMNLLIDEFNDTVGKDKGIQVRVTNVTGTSKILAQLLDAQAGNPGAAELPDLFSCHTQNAPALGAENLLDFGEWFSEDELDGYVPEFLNSGMLDGKLAVFPVSKSTYALFINGSQFDRFAADTGVTYENLSDWNSFFAAAEKYYEWSGGKPFCAFDYLIRHMELDVLSKTGKLEYTENGWYDTEDTAIKDSFGMFAEALAKGHVAVSDLYANTQVMTGDVLCGIGSSAAVGYYNDTVTYPDNTSEPMKLQVMALPRSGGENEYMPQTGGYGHIARLNNEIQIAFAFGEPFHKFVGCFGFLIGCFEGTDSNTGAFEAIGSYTFTDDGYANLYSAIKTMYDEYIPVVRPDFDGFYDKTNALYDGLRKMQPSLTERYEKGEAIGELTEAIWDFFCGID